VIEYIILNITLLEMQIDSNNVIKYNLYFVDSGATIVNIFGLKRLIDPDEVIKNCVPIQ